MYVLGTFDPGSTVYAYFNSRTTTRAPVALAGSPAVAVYDRDSTTQTTTGVTLTEGFDSITGLNLATVSLAADPLFYASGHEYGIVLTAGTAGGISVAGARIATFRLSGSAAGLDAVHRTMIRHPRSRRTRARSPRG